MAAGDDAGSPRAKRRRIADVLPVAARPGGGRGAARSGAHVLAAMFATSSCGSRTSRRGKQEGADVPHRARGSDPVRGVRGSSGSTAALEEIGSPAWEELPPADSARRRADRVGPRVHGASSPVEDVQPRLEREPERAVHLLRCGRDLAAGGSRPAQLGRLEAAARSTRAAQASSVIASLASAASARRDWIAGSAASGAPNCSRVRACSTASSSARAASPRGTRASRRSTRASTTRRRPARAARSR